MLLFIRARPTPRFSGPAHAPLSSHSLSDRQSGPARQPRRCATAETETPPAGRSQAPHRPAPHGISAATPPPLCCPSPPLKKEPLGDFLLPCAPFISPVHARAPHTLPPPPRRPPHQLSATGAPPSRRTPSERRRRPPPCCERPLSCSFPQSTAASSLRWSPSSYRTSPRSSRTTRATPPPLNAAARRRLLRLTVGTPFRCAPTPSSLPGASPVAPSRSPVTPCRRRATTEPPTSTPPRCPARSLHVMTTPAYARCHEPHGLFPPPGRAARPRPRGCFGRPRVVGCNTPWAVASAGFQPNTVLGDLNVFQLF
jgi:hypothetical protein